MQGRDLVGEYLTAVERRNADLENESLIQRVKDLEKELKIDEPTVLDLKYEVVVDGMHVKC